MLHRAPRHAVCALALALAAACADHVPLAHTSAALEERTIDFEQPRAVVAADLDGDIFPAT
jgi:hypothetical protein